MFELRYQQELTPIKEDGEIFPIVDENGNVTGSVTRKSCHSGSMNLHPVVHLHLMNDANQLYLQKRAETKDIQPGKWDTAVGGHIDFGESIMQALLRETREELGITNFSAQYIMSYTFSSSREKELVNVFMATSDKTPIPDKEEISEGRFWTYDEIEQSIGKDIFTPNFEQEFIKIKESLFTK